MNIIDREVDLEVRVMDAASTNWGLGPLFVLLSLIYPRAREPEVYFHTNTKRTPAAYYLERSLRLVKIDGWRLRSLGICRILTSPHCMGSRRRSPHVSRPLLGAP
jgi:hypothetical protein